MSLGMPGQRQHPDVLQAGQRVFETALRMGVPPRAEILTADEAKRYLDMGVRHFSISYDLRILHSFWQENGEQVRRALEG
jgi:2-keto-3-deoxy-L-rhamnonate aldolase RhmA